MKEFNCPIGMLITQDESGDYVPFLVKVRDKEIIWDMDKYTDETVNAINNIGADIVTINDPLPSYRVLKDGWIIMSYYDGTIEAHKEIKFNDSSVVFNSLKPTNDMVSTKIVLPFKVGEFPSINVTMNAANEEMYLVNQTISVNKTDFGNISGFDIILTKIDGTQLNNYLSSSVYVSIKGKIAYE